MSAKKKTSLVWNYFEEVSETAAKCLVCSRIVKRPKGNTSNLTAHVHRDHDKESSELQQKESRRRLETQFNEEVSESVARRLYILK